MELPLALKMKSELLALLELKNVGAITEAEFLENKSELFRTPAHAILTPFLQGIPTGSSRSMGVLALC